MNKLYLPLLSLACLIISSLTAQVNDNGRPDNLNSTKAFNQNSSRSNHTRGGTRAFNQNSSRSNHTRAVNDWQFGLNIGASLGLKSNEASLFRGNGLYTGITGQYFWGTFGLGMNMGFTNTNLSTSAIDQFIIDRKIPQGSTITTTPSQNTFLLLGPSVRFGNTVQLLASVKGGLFMNQGGGLSIAQQGAVRPFYRFDAGSKTLFPGLSSSIAFSYPLGTSTSIQLHADYFFSSCSVRVFDPTQGIDIPVEQKRNIQALNTGISFVKTFGNSGRGKESVGKRQNRDPLDPDSDDDGVSLLEQGNSRRVKVGEKQKAWTQANFRTNNSCGPVTVKKQSPDGTIEERTFACPEDALQYERKIESTPSRISTNRNAAPNNTVDSNGIASHTIYGRIHTTSSGSGDRIITNQLSGGTGAASASYAATGRRIEPGVQTSFYIRESSGSKKRTAAGSEKSYQLVFSEEGGTVDSTLGKIANNPLYSEKGNKENPLHSRTASGDFNGDGFGDIAEVSLIDRNSGALLATTRTDNNGAYWFANVPNGNYEVQVVAAWRSKKGYQYYQNQSDKRMDIAGKKKGYDYYQNQSDKRVDIGGKISIPAETWHHTFSVDADEYVEYLPVYTGDTDGDRCDDLIIGSPKSDNDNSSDVDITAARPGSPIGGLTIKGGKNPGGNIFAERVTNSRGEFEFTNLEPGDYRFITEVNYVLKEYTVLDLNNQGSTVYSKSGDVKITASQNSQSLKTGGSTPIKDNGPKVTVSQNSQSLRNGLSEMNQQLDILSQLLNQEINPKLNEDVNQARVHLEKLKETIATICTDLALGTIREPLVKQKAMSSSFDLLQQTLLKMGGRYAAVSNTLKTKHDTAKNAIGNVR